MKKSFVVAVPDVHVPFEDKGACALLMGVIEDLRPTHVVQVGDCNDFDAVSLHAKKYGRDTALEYELDAGQKFRGRLRKAGQGAEMVWLLGNHEDRLHRYVAGSAPRAEAAMKGWDELLGTEPGEAIIPYQSAWKLGRVTFVHDVGFSGAHATHQTLTAVGGSVVHGHTHRGAVVYGGTTEGDRWFGVGAGWLGDVDKINYMSAASTRGWQLGFATIRYDSGLAWAQFHPIIKNGRKYRCSVNGKEYRG